MVDYIRSDLEFILEQIKIAEAHAAGQPLYGVPGALVPAYNLSYGLRTVDGSYNNLLPGQEYWGSSGQAFPTYADPNFRTFLVDPDGPGPSPAIPMTYTPGVDPDGAGTRAGPSDVFDPYVRTISNLLVDQTLANPAAIVEALKRNGIEGDLLAIAADIKGTYEQPLSGVQYGGKSVLGLFKSVDDAGHALDNAEAAYAANQTSANLTAVTNAQNALNAAETLLAQGRADASALPGGSFDGLLDGYGLELSGANVVLLNIAPDAGLSAPFNSWFTLFGQFFDHGLDLVSKGGSGTVFIPLQPDDPLYVPGSQTNFMVLSRATIAPGEDGILGTADDVRPINVTTPFVDQNQTYTSHPSHQVFLREYSMVNGRPETTGRLIEGADGGMANWGELKEYTREFLGINLTDQDVGMVPLLRTDPYGNFIPGSNGFPQVIVGIGADGIPNTADDIVIQGDPSANGGLGISLATAIRTPMSFIVDIAHNAVPNGLADGDSAIGLSNGDGSSTAGLYDDELLDAHFIAGDGRVNENIGLTAVHHVFHAEHNRLLQHTKDVVLATGDIAFINQWLDTPIAAIPTNLATLDWNGDRLFQTAKFGTEMQYQHLVFEEFARKIQPTINPFLVPNGYDATINPSIMAEFAHVVYRFGHSMLTESIDRFDSSFGDQSISLIDGFLNPIAFNDGGTTLDGVAAGDIIRGMTRQQGNHIDEFVTSALRNNLLGLPLDLATINLARGRDVGVPSLNAARREFYAATENNAQLKPYDSWVDFADNLKNEASIINFIAAYGTHPLITGQSTIEGKRDAALTIITGNSVGGLAVPSDAVDFLNATGAYAGGKLGGLEDVDLWIGGLAEKTMAFGGMLGSTFNFVFEVQMEALQNGDRFYYLQRMVGTHFLTELEANSLAAMVMKATDATHLPADIFSVPTWILEVDPSRQANDVDGNGTLESTDPTSGDLLRKLVIRDNPATAGSDTNYLKYTGEDHVVMGGTNNNDRIIAGAGDDTVYGDGGNDILEGGFGNDQMVGGAGDDIITDTGGDDVMKGGAGNDAISGGPGLDLILGGDGKDFIVLGTDPGSESFGGTGNDFILGTTASEPSIGGEGDDWMEGGMGETGVGDTFDDVNAADLIRGNDVMIGDDGGFDEMTGEGGDDIMVGSLGFAKMAGMSGFDWATYKDLPFGMDISLLDDFVFDEAPVAPGDTTIQRFESIEGLSGTRFDDRLAGTNFTSADRVPNGPDHAIQGSLLDAQGIALINGLQAVLGAGVTSYNAGDILLGGAGSDAITGGGGDDIIDGDKWLNVRISVRANNDGSGSQVATFDSMKDLAPKIFDGTYNPGQLVIVREILDISAAQKENSIDVAVFSGARDEYDVLTNADGTTTVTHARPVGPDDGIDSLRNIERLQFTDQIVVLSGPPLPQAPTLDLNGAAAGTGFTSTFAEDGAAAAISAGVTVSDPDTANMASAQIRLTNAFALDALSIAGALPAGITSSINTAVAGQITLTLSGSASLAAYQTAIEQVRYSTTSQNPDPTARNIEVTVNDGAANSPLAIATVNVVGVNDAPVLDLDGAAAGTGNTSTFTEDGAAAAVGVGVVVSDTDSANMVSATIRLTNAVALDVLSIAGALPAGITSSINTAVPGQITLTLSGAASAAAYQTAIGQVRYSTTSQNPVVTPRNLEVTVNDGQASSPVAIATVNVVSVNDAPVAVNETVITNLAAGAAIVIPNSVLLANDTDVDSLVLSLTAVSAPTGVNGLSLATNPGSVTLTDDATPGGAFTYTVSDGALTSNGRVTLVRQLPPAAQVADNFNGVGNVRSAANNSTGTTAWATSWTELDDGANTLQTGQIQIDGGGGNGTNQLRFINGDGGSITRGVNLSGATAATLTFDFDKNGIDVGESVQVQFAADGVNFVNVTNGLITNTNNTAASGNAAGTLSLALTGAFGASSAIRFVGTTISTAGEDVRIDNLRIDYSLVAAGITGTAAGEVILGDGAGSIINALGGNDRIVGGGDNDTVNAGDGDDTIIWSVGDGRDFVDGGANGVVGDRFIVNGDDSVENFVVYARAEAILAGFTPLNGATEIVVTRNGIVVGELDGIEEITINTAGGDDTVSAVGNFNPTSLFFNTVTVNGGSGADRIDASQLTSAHRLVLNEGGSTATVAPAAPGTDGGFGGVGQSTIDELARNGLLDRNDDALGFVGTRHNGIFSSALFDPGDLGYGVYRNSIFDREPAMEFASNVFEHAAKLQQHQALHFDAADHLIS